MQERKFSESDLTGATPLPRRGAGRPTREQAETRLDGLLDTAPELFLERGLPLHPIESPRSSTTTRTPGPRDR